MAITVTNVEEVPVFTSGGAASAAENQTAAYTATASDGDGDSPTFSIVGGADFLKFNIDAATGVLTFVTAPDFEVPGDANGDNVYDVVILASDGTNNAFKNVAITVTNVNAPVITSGAANDVSENQTFAYQASAFDDEGDTLNFSLSGADAALFDIDAATGAVTFKSAPDFEAPADASANNVYDVVVTASDGANSTDRAVTITVTDVNDNAPVFTSGTTAEVVENEIAGFTAAAADADAGTTLVFSLSGTDASLFNIDSTTGVVTFKTAPNFEAPGDAGSNNVYDVIVTASDGLNSTDRVVAITVTNVNDIAPVFTSGATASVPENGTAAYTAVASDADGNPLTYSIAGIDAALFDIDAATGTVTFKTAPDFEGPADAGANNVYDVVVTATDGINSTDQAVAISVTGLNDTAPNFTSPSSASVETGLTATNYAAIAPDADGDAVTYSITGGADAALFSINATSGVVVFNSSSDFANPLDVGGDNVYDLTVTASDGTFSVDQNVAITVVGPQFLSTGALKLSSATPGRLAGASVTGLSDIDGDGHSEIAVGAMFGALNAVYVVFSQTMLSLVPGGTPDFDAMVASGDAVRIDGRLDGTLFGRTVVDIGDIDGDGLSELAIGAPGFDGASNDVGEITVVYGSAIAAAHAGSGVINTGALNRNISVVIRGDQRSTGFPGDPVNLGIAIAPYGDWDGDGKADFIATMPGFDATGVLQQHRTSGDNIGSECCCRRKRCAADWPQSMPDRSRMDRVPTLYSGRV